jgi:hypothetical protein
LSTTKLHLSNDLSLPIDVATQASAIFGIRGSGKTNTAGVIAEELLRAGQPVAIIDPTDAWWGLRSEFQVFIFGGSHQDLPLQETDGKVIAEFIVQEQVPLILSLRHLRKAAQRRFVTELFEELYHLKGRDEYRAPLTVFIDEAPLFAPQKVMGEVARTVGAVEDLIARGRNSGFGVVQISQRPATLNADVRSLCDTIITHRITSPLDRKAFLAWIEENASIEEADRVLESLAKLRNGEAWIWSPQLDVFQRVQVRMRRSYDSSRTPKPGEKLQSPKKLAEVDLQKLKGRLAESIEKARAEDPRELKKKLSEQAKRIQELEKRPAAAAGKEKRVEVPVIKDAQIQRLERVAKTLDGAVGKVAGIVTAAHSKADGLNKLAGDVSVAVVSIMSSIGQAKAPPPSPPAAAPTRHEDEDDNGSTSAAVELSNRVVEGAPEWMAPQHQRLVDALRWLEKFGNKEPDRSILAAVAGESPSSSGYEKALGRLRTAELITYPRPGLVSLSAAGAAIARPPKSAPTRKALHDAWRKCPALSPQHVRLLNAVISIFPEQISRDDLAAKANESPSSSGYEKALGRMRSLGLVEYPNKGFVRATDLLFPEGVS